MPLHTVTLTLTVETNADTTPDEIASTVEHMLNAGLCEAQEALDNGDDEVQWAQLATELTIHAPVVSTKPRVLVTVTDGAGDFVSDEGVDVVVFDRDMPDDEQSEHGVPARFASLALPNGIPVLEG